MLNATNVLKDSHICNSPARVSARCGSCFGKKVIFLTLRNDIEESNFSGTFFTSNEKVQCNKETAYCS